MKSNADFKIVDRQRLEKIEHQTLAPYAAQSSEAHSSRQHAEPEHGYRTAFQRDRDRIVHSRAFRRLKHKRQVFLTSESDHYRTRITHTLEVSQISRTMARALGLNEDLAEAIALGHDIGHTPFGHLGEVILNEIMTGEAPFAGQEAGQNFGGFKHNYQSLRVVDFLERKYAFNGLNLTAPVREGILKHTRLLRGRFNFPDFHYEGLNFERDMASVLEGQVVAICDEIAQRTHDLEDGIRAKLVDAGRVRELPIAQLIEEKLQIRFATEHDRLLYPGLLIRGLINLLVDDVIQNSLAAISDFVRRKKRTQNFDEELIRFSAPIDPLQKELNKFIYKEIIDYSTAGWSDDLGQKLLFRLFEAYYTEPTLLPEFVLAKYFEEYEGPRNGKRNQIKKSGAFYRLICDHIAGMTDTFAVREAERLAEMNKFEAGDLHLEAALSGVPFKS
jgi:dGTPase